MKFNHLAAAPPSESGRGASRCTAKTPLGRAAADPPCPVAALRRPRLPAFRPRQPETRRADAPRQLRGVRRWARLARPRPCRPSHCGAKARQGGAPRSRCNATSKPGHGQDPCGEYDVYMHPRIYGPELPGSVPVCDIISPRHSPFPPPGQLRLWTRGARRAATAGQVVWNRLSPRWGAAFAWEVDSPADQALLFQAPAPSPRARFSERLEFRVCFYFPSNYLEVGDFLGPPARFSPAIHCRQDRGLLGPRWAASGGSAGLAV